uniref:Uncharacterized protein n=1 Tax=Babesia bovis TaxID=5865 RepID=S6C7V0_BABBO|nr:hypothetical protein [Babesia bovis]
MLWRSHYEQCVVSSPVELNYQSNQANTTYIYDMPASPWCTQDLLVIVPWSLSRHLQAWAPPRYNWFSEKQVTYPKDLCTLNNIEISSAVKLMTSRCDTRWLLRLEVEIHINSTYMVKEDASLFL